MKKNKVLISIAMIFIVLLSTIVVASNEMSTTSSNIQGSGTEEDPYVIAGDVTFSASKIPFYFEVSTPGVYQVFWSVDNVVTFTLKQSGKDSGTYISVNSAKRAKSENWQLGIKTVANTTPTSAEPVYAIRECSSYETRNQDITSIYPDKYYLINNEVKLATDYYANNYMTDEQIDESNEMLEKINNGEYLNLTVGHLGTASSVSEGNSWVSIETPIVNRTMTLFNATYKTERSGYAVTSGDYYYFTNFNEEKSLYTSMGYKENQYVSDYFGEDALYNSTFAELGTSPSVIFMEQPRSLVYQFAGNYSAPEDGSSEKAGWLEEQIVNLLISFGDKFLLTMLRSEKVLGPTLSIDTLIFDEYDKTKLDLYGESSSSVTAAIKKTVNYWFEAFKILAYVVYMIILVYTGIMIILNAGTGKQDKWKSYLGNWVMGIALLVLIPKYGIPYLFKINTAFVSYIGSGHRTMKSYYNNYDASALKKKYPNIMGSASTTLSVEELTGIKEELETESTVAYNVLQQKIRNQFQKVAVSLKKDLKSDGNNYTEDIDTYVDEYVEKRFEILRELLDGWTNHGYTDEKIEDTLVKVYGPQQNYSFGYGTDMVLAMKCANAFSDTFLTGDHKSVKSSFMSLIVEYCELARDIDIVDDLIETTKTDLMGMMRAYAGKYGRIIFVFLWFVLFFQLISMVIIYFKRLFMVAILIAIFPLIMMSYALDKMGDGKSQTLSLWLKELLANVFLQSVHAVIYVVLIEMGLEIYAADQTNWMLLMASVFMLIPAEALLKDIFDLNGSTVGKLGGALMGTLTAIGSTIGIARSWKGKNDESVTKKNNERFKKLQNSQSRADIKAATRRNKRDAARASGQPVKYNALRENMYAAASNVRSTAAKVAPHVDNAVRNAKNVTAVVAGSAIAIAGGDVQSIGQGAQIANAITGKGNKLEDEKVDIKSELSSAYMRNKSSIKAEKATEKAKNDAVKIRKQAMRNMGSKP